MTGRQRRIMRRGWRREKKKQLQKRNLAVGQPPAVAHARRGRVLEMPGQHEHSGDVLILRHT
jgi:hypothetical protein